MQDVPNRAYTLRLFVENVEREVQTNDNHTWTPAGWTPTTTSSRFQLVSQVARLDANSGCSRWGDRSFAFRRRSPSFAPVVVVVDLAAPSQRALRSRLLLRSLSPCSIPSAAPTWAPASRSCAFFPALPTLLRPPSASCALCHLSLYAPSPLSSSSRMMRPSPCLRMYGARCKSRFRLEDASRLLTPSWVFPMRQRHARPVGWRSPPA